MANTLSQKEYFKQNPLPKLGEKADKDLALKAKHASDMAMALQQSSDDSDFEILPPKKKSKVHEQFKPVGIKKNNTGIHNNKEGASSRNLNRKHPNM